MLIIFLGFATFLAYVHPLMIAPGLCPSRYIFRAFVLQGFVHLPFLLIVLNPEQHVRYTEGLSQYDLSCCDF